MAKALLEQRWDITIVVAAIGHLWAIAPFKPRDATPNASLTATLIPLAQFQRRIDETLRQKLLPIPLR